MASITCKVNVERYWWQEFTVVAIIAQVEVKVWHYCDNAHIRGGYSERIYRCYNFERTIEISCMQKDILKSYR